MPAAGLGSAFSVGGFVANWRNLIVLFMRLLPFNNATSRQIVVIVRTDRRGFRNDILLRLPLSLSLSLSHYVKALSIALSASAGINIKLCAKIYN